MAELDCQRLRERVRLRCWVIRLHGVGLAEASAVQNNQVRCVASLALRDGDVAAALGRAGHRSVCQDAIDRSDYSQKQKFLPAPKAARGVRMLVYLQYAGPPFPSYVMLSRSPDQWFIARLWPKYVVLTDDG